MFLMSLADSIQWVVTNIPLLTHCCDLSCIHHSLCSHRYFFSDFVCVSEWKFPVGDQSQWDTGFISGEEGLTAGKDCWAEGQELHKDLQASVCKFRLGFTMLHEEDEVLPVLNISLESLRQNRFVWNLHYMVAVDSIIGMGSNKFVVVAKDKKKSKKTTNMLLVVLLMCLLWSWRPQALLLLMSLWQWIQISSLVMKYDQRLCPLHRVDLIVLVCHRFHLKRFSEGGGLDFT